MRFLLSVIFIGLMVFCHNPVKNELIGEITLADIDGNVYRTINIGNQIWTVDNLRTTKFNDGAPIPIAIIGQKATEPAMCFYDNTTDTVRIEEYGALYNWHAIHTGKLAPLGWHIPSEAEWDTLYNYLLNNGFNWDGSATENKVAKSLAAQVGWDSSVTVGAVGYNVSSNNSSGFTALPGGRREEYAFRYFGEVAYWWTSTVSNITINNIPSAYYRSLYYQSESMNKNAVIDQSYCFSIRLVKDQP